MRLPEAFVNRMRRILVNEFEDFMASYDEARHYGLRVNTLKVPVEDFRQISPFSLSPVPWAHEGFYISEEDRPAKHPYYHAGLYYIQEPSAMITVSVLDPRPGEKILDLCAAPGGKSTQIAARLAGEGVLVANDVNFERIKGLVRNLEMFGVTNCVVLHELPKRLAKHFSGYFDKIVIDAPCSGEGMFRKDPLAVRSWGDFSIDKCTGMQRSILKQVPVMLKPGGRLVYSTCTFSPEENEGMIDTFIKDNPEFEVMHIETIEDIEGLAPGRPDWADAGDSLDRSIRLWPHRIKGEGHFVTLLKKREDCEDAVTEYRSPPPPVANLEGYNDFVQDSLEIKPEEVFQGSLIQHYSKLYLAPEGAPDLRGLKVVRPGWFLGELQKDRFKPGAPLALGLKKEHAKRVLDFPSDSQEVIRYLKGETLEMTGEYGWNLVCVDGFPLGWAKILRDRFNNYYPSGWRWLD